MINEPGVSETEGGGKLTWAEEYDRATRAEGQWTGPSEAATVLLPYVEPGDRLLDIGSGTGQSLEPFSAKVSDMEGIEASAEMIGVAQRKLPRANFTQGDLESVLPTMEAGRFDKVVAVGVLEFAKDLDEALRQISRVLNSRGMAVVTVEELVSQSPRQGQELSVYGEGPDALTVRRYTPEEVARKLQESGFDLVENHQFQAYIRDGNPVLFQLFLARRRVEF